MARLNIEEHAFGEGRLENLAESVGWTKAQALGHLAFLWHDSQEKLKTSGTRAELVAWGRVKRSEGEAFVLALMEHGYVTSKDGKYEIHGNASQIEQRVSALTGSSKGGAATKAKWDAIKEAEAKEKSERAKSANEGPGHSPGHSPDQGGGPSPDHASDQAVHHARATLNARQCKAMQGNAVQGTPCGGTDDGEGDHSPTFGPRELAALWNDEVKREGEIHPTVRLGALKANQTRWKACLARLSDEPDPEYWREVIQRLLRWPHGRGMTPPKNPGESPWVATFDFLVKPSTHVRASEGEFTPRKGQAPPGSRAQRDAGMVESEVTFVMADDQPTEEAAT